MGTSNSFVCKMSRGAIGREVQTNILKQSNNITNLLAARAIFPKIFSYVIPIFHNTNQSLK